MIRYSLLVMAMIVIAIVAQKNWFRALCYMLPMLAFLERPDMPRQMLGISGLNPFNILLGIILIAWFVQRRSDGSKWDASDTASRLLIAYLLVLLVATVRVLMDYDALEYYFVLDAVPVLSKGGYIMESVVNSGKWIIPGLLISVGAKTEDRVRLAVIALLLTGAALSVQIISKMLPALVGADDLGSRALRVLDRDLGYHRVSLAAITASAAWAFVAAKPILKTRFRGLISLGGFALCTVAMAATGGRAGILAWTVAALTFGFIRWRKILILVPVFALLSLAVIPGLQERLVAGFSQGSTEQSTRQETRRFEMGAIDTGGRDRYAITSGRAFVWPMIFDKAMERPLVGHGRQGMYRSGIVARLASELRINTFGHPHNAYLELFLDTGIIGLLIVGAFYWLLLRRSVSAFNEDSGVTKYVVASTSLAFLLVNLTASIGSQSFYPKEGATLFWVAIGLALTWLTKESQSQPVQQAGVSAQGSARN